MMGRQRILPRWPGMKAERKPERRAGSKEKGVKGAAVLLLCLLMAFFAARPSLASEYNTGTDGGEREKEQEETDPYNTGMDEKGMERRELDALLEALDLNSIENFLKRQPQTEPVTFRGLMETLMKGDFAGVFHQCLGILRDSLFAEIAEGGSWLGQVMMLGLVGALFANFSNVFSNSQIAETGFYVTYLLMFTFLAASFLTGIAVTGELLERILEFVRALVPSYFLAVSFAGGGLTSAAGYGWMLFSINLAQWAFLKLLMPLIRIHILLVLTGHLVKENLFSRMTELLETGIRWGIKSVVGVILGFQMLQSMVLPYADSMKNTSLQRMVSVIPGIGQGAAAVSQMVMGAGVLIKNTMGAAAVLVLVLLSLVPLIKLLALCILYRLAAAVLQPVCDKRMVSCINGAGNGFWMLLYLSGTALLLFGFSLAIVCMSANAAYFAG